MCEWMYSFPIKTQSGWLQLAFRIVRVESLMPTTDPEGRHSLSRARKGPVCLRVNVKRPGRVDTGLVLILIRTWSNRLCRPIRGLLFLCDDFRWFTPPADILSARRAWKMCHSLSFMAGNF